MSRQTASDPRRWAFAGAFAIVGGVVVLALFGAPRMDAGPPRAQTVSTPVLMRSDSGIDAAFDEQKVLADPTPLFLPTRWNAARQPVRRPEPGATFADYAPNYVGSVVAEELKADFPNSDRLPATAVEVLGDSPGALLIGIGRAPGRAPVVSERGAFLEITSAATGQAVLRQPLLDARPPGGDSWQPMEFLAHVNTMGLVGSLALTRRSGAEGVDDYFQRYLVQTVRVGQRLAPGVYRISVGP